MADVYEFGPFRFDATARVLWRGATLVAVAPRALDLLAVLLSRPGDVLTKDELLQRAWPDAVVEEANLSVNVSLLRKALGGGPGGKPWIATVARRGYRFAGPVHAAARAPRAIAVLPFRALGGVDEALGLAMADAVITRLAGSGVAVRPTSAVQRYATGEVDPREAGRALRAEAVLDGRVQRDRDRLRVTVQLLPVSGDAPLWADRFDHPAGDLFAVQDAVAERLAAALAVQPAAARPRPANLAAYEAYARGRWFWTRFSPSWIGKAVAAFHESVDRDPSYAPPHAGLADVSLVAGLAGLLPPRDAWDAAAAEAERALALDDALPEAHVSAAWVRLFRDWDWAGAARGFERAASLPAASAAVLQWRGLFETLRGRDAAAAESLAAARVLDPLSVAASAIEGFRLELAGQGERALEQQRRTMELDPHQFLGHWALGTTLQNVGRLEEAVAAHRRALELAEDAAIMRPVLARSLALAGDHAAARALLERGEGLVSPYQEATVWLALGDRERALERLAAACDARDPWAVVIPIDPMLRPLHGDPRFTALSSRVREVPPHASEDRR